jgi:hypothetical protein
VAAADLADADMKRGIDVGPKVLASVGRRRRALEIA